MENMILRACDGIPNLLSAVIIALSSRESNAGFQFKNKRCRGLLVLLGVRIRGTLGDIDPLNKVP